jgi:hypothetical protein
MALASPFATVLFVTVLFRHKAKSRPQLEDLAKPLFVLSNAIIQQSFAIISESHTGPASCENWSPAVGYAEKMIEKCLKFYMYN